MLLSSQSLAEGLGPAATSTLLPARASRDMRDGQRRGRAALLPLAGPAIMASVGYMDPGNFATNIQAGSTCGYRLLWVVLLASLVAMLFQAMSAKLGIVTGRNLAELCRDEFPRPIVIGMWIASEIAAMATDLAEFLGGALGISLLFHVSLLAGLTVTGIATCAILQLDKRGNRPLELAIAALVGVIGLGYLFELVIAPPDWPLALFHTVVPQLPDRSAVTLAVGIIGATIMPHTLYLHSALTQSRSVSGNDTERRSLLASSNRAVIVALGFAALVNLAMVVMAAVVFSKSTPGIADMAVAYRTLGTALGGVAAGAFVVALIASGISSSAVGTIAGQVIMQGFVGFRIPMWVRRSITMVPAFVIAYACNPVTAMVFSQVVLSLVVPIPLFALVVLSRRATVMGKFVIGQGEAFVAFGATALIVMLNAVLILLLMG